MSDVDALLDPAPPPKSAFWIFVETAMILAFIGMLAVMLIQVVSRYALAIGVPWTDEASRYLYITQIFLGLAVAERYGMNIRVTLVLDMLSTSIRSVIEAIGYLLTIAIAVAVLFGAMRMINQTGNVAASTLPVTMAWLYGVQALGLALYIMLLAKDVVATFRRTSSEAHAS
jgi:TRAP-type transport system small permease protein